MLTCVAGLGSGGPAQAFTWLLTLSTVAGLIAWGELRPNRTS